MPKETLEILMTADNKAAMAALKQTAAGIEGVSIVSQKATAKMADFAKSSNTAGNALTNLGRVAQDVPFGFVGIQNNLNPLLESFQRLKTETGSTGGALKALAGSLMGAGGLGLALSVASSAFLLFGDKLFDTGKKAEATKKAFDDITAGIAKDASTITQLVEKYKDSNLTLGQRKTILDQLNKVSPEYFAGLDKEGTTYDQLTKASDAYIKSLTKQVQLKVLQAQYEKNIDKLLQNQVENEKVRALQADFARKNKTGAEPVGLPQNAKLEKDNKLLLNQIAALTVIEEKTKNISFGADGTKNQNTNQTKEKFEAVTRENKAYADAIQVQQRLLDVQKEMAAISQKQYDTDVKREALTRLGKPLMEGKFAGTQNATLAEGVAQQETTKAQMLLAAEQNRKIAIDEINAKLVEQQTLAQSIGQSFANIFQNVVTAKDPFEALGNSVKQLVIDLTAAAIKMLVIKAIMTAINPAGAAISKVGGIVGSIIGGGGFAKGGVSYGPQGGHMELLHGTEAVLTPSQMSGLVRNSMNAGAVQSMGSNSGQDMNISGEFVARGQDLVLALQRSNYSLNLRRG